MTEREYLLTCLMEECSEMAQAASKCLRFGDKDIGPRQHASNLEQLDTEFNDVVAVIELFSKYADLTIDVAKIDSKKEKLKHWIEYSQRLGVVDATSN